MEGMYATLFEAYYPAILSLPVWNVHYGNLPTSIPLFFMPLLLLLIRQDHLIQLFSLFYEICRVMLEPLRRVPVLNSRGLLTVTLFCTAQVQVIQYLI